SEDKNNPESLHDDPTSPTLMAFDYVDKYGAKNLGVLNLSTRAPNNWGLHGNGVGDDGNRVAPSWVKRRRRRPSFEETEEWKRALLDDMDVDTPPNVPEENEIIRDDNIKSIDISDMKSIGASHAQEKAKTCVP
ncbi:15810_t:CDS:1, partial [Acaulospora morrowiae]